MEIDKFVCEQITEEQLFTLTNVVTKDVKAFSFNERCFLAKCVEVYDGDTCKLIFYDNGKMIKYSFRMLGYNAPEITRVEPHIKQLGILMRDKMRSMILNKVIYVVCGKFEKYGRILAYLYQDPTKTVCFNDEMAQYLTVLEQGEKIST